MLLIPLNNAYARTDINNRNFLEQREQLWPNWKLSNLKASDLKEDLIYPSWFEGNWNVKSSDGRDSKQKSIFYKVNFFKNENGQIIGNRQKNSESIGKAIFGERLIKVKGDPKSFNNQIIYLSNNEYIDSRTVGRTQIMDDNLFFSDEFIIQNVHKPEASRLNQVEIMSKFYKCKKDKIGMDENHEFNICGTQYVATYGSKIGQNNLKAITANKYLLVFTSIEN